MLWQVHDVAVDALFRKAGIVRCYGREELATVAGIFLHKELKGKNIAIITHAGGPAVMLTDALSNGGMDVPHIESPTANDLLELLYPGSSVANPIDFFATGTAEQFGNIIDYCDEMILIILMQWPLYLEVPDYLKFTMFIVYSMKNEGMQKANLSCSSVDYCYSKREIAHFLGAG